MQRALRKINKEAAKEVMGAFREAAEPIVSTAKSRLSAYPGASVGTIGPRVAPRSVFVTQRAKKVSGLRPDFGVLQMQRVLIPALEQHQDDVVQEVEKALDALGREAGF